MSDKPNPQRITVDLREQEAEGIYANLALATFSAAEFILDFARIVPGLPKARVHSRIIMTPQSAKALQKLLQANLERYEAQHGEIRGGGPHEGGPAIGFQTGSSN